MPSANRTEPRDPRQQQRPAGSNASRCRTTGEATSVTGPPGSRASAGRPVREPGSPVGATAMSEPAERQALCGHRAGGGRMADPGVAGRRTTCHRSRRRPSRRGSGRPPRTPSPLPSSRAQALALKSETHIAPSLARTISISSPLGAQARALLGSRAGVKDTDPTGAMCAMRSPRIAPRRSRQARRERADEASPGRRACKAPAASLRMSSRRPPGTTHDRPGRARRREGAAGRSETALRRHTADRVAPSRRREAEPRAAVRGGDQLAIVEPNRKPRRVLGVAAGAARAAPRPRSGRHCSHSRTGDAYRVMTASAMRPHRSHARRSR